MIERILRASRRVPLALVASTVLLVSPVAYAGDRKPPTAPTNLIITGTTAYSVSLAWSPSTDNSGSFKYRVFNNDYGAYAVVPGNQTAYTFGLGLVPGSTYSFYVDAVDAAGNVSKKSNTVSAAIPLDTTPPQEPQLSLVDSGPRHLTLNWTTQDDDPTLVYLLYMNDSVLKSGTIALPYTVTPLSSATTYTFTVQARDSGGNWSPMSAPLVAATEAGDENDVTPPTTPGLYGGPIADCEVMFFYSPSTDNLTPHELMLYKLLLNGVMVQGRVGGSSMIEYGAFDGPNVFELIAVDEAGNASEPATAVIEMSNCIH
jgi:chitodextrinase